MNESVASRDQDHLRLLAIFQFVFAGLTALSAVACSLQLVFGYFMISRPELLGPGESPPAFFGWMIVGAGLFFLLLSLLLTGLCIFAGRNLRARKGYTFCLVVGVLECLMVPFGTALGIFTIVVLLRESVKRLFSVG